jgi:hypothetical protein
MGNAKYTRGIGASGYSESAADSAIKMNETRQRLFVDFQFVDKTVQN